MELSQVIFIAVIVLTIGFFAFALYRARQRRRAELYSPDTSPVRLVETPSPADAKVAAEPPKSSEVPSPPALRLVEEPVDQRLTAGLKRTHDGLLGRLSRLFVGKEIPADLFTQVEEVLLTSDIGVKTAHGLLDKLKGQLNATALRDQASLLAALEDDVREVLEKAAGAQWILPKGRPAVLLMVGVNGVGKTTTIGKLAAQFKAQGLKVMVAAGDTFRAAAADQLEIWAQRSEVEYFRGGQGKDPASVIFEACQKAVADQIDVVIADTAGRLHTKTNLMEELKKVKRVIGKVIPEAPHEVFLVVDATTGQNAVTQAREFNEALGLTGIVLTKLDGTAKGGVVIAITAELNVPIRFIGVGESVDDLRPFAADQFAQALFSRA